MKTKLYDRIKHLLTNQPELRNSDKLLMWTVWQDLGYAGNQILKSTFLGRHMPTPETITRCRRKIQELHHELGASKRIGQIRRNIAKQKGTFIFRDPLITKEQFDFENQR